MANTTRTETRHCKSCLHEIDSRTVVDGQRSPEEGDYSICFYCGTISVFDDNMNLRAITEEEKLKIDAENMDLLNRAAKLIKERISQN